MSTLVALDLETDGLIEPGEMPEILEIGIAKIKVSGKDTYSEVTSVSFPILPDKYKTEELPEVITDITGLTAELLRKDGMPLSRALWKLSLGMVGVYNLITFNGPSFDLPILVHHLGPDAYKFPWPPVQIDLMEASKDIVKAQGKQGRKNPNLRELVDFCLGSDVQWGAHRAKDDALITLDCARYMIEHDMLKVFTNA